MKILVIDDEDDIRRISRLALGRVGGMQVLDAASGIEGIAKAVAESGSTESEGIVKYWNTLSKYPGYFGTYTFTPTQHNGYPTDEIVMSEASTAKNGTFAVAPGYT